MKQYGDLGRKLFGLPFLAFGINHFLMGGAILIAVSQDNQKKPKTE